MTAPGRFRHQLLRNTGATVAGNAWAIVVGVVSVPLLLRGLGRVEFGTWVLLQTFSASIGWLSLADLGVGTATTRAVAGRASTGDTDGVRRVVTGSLGVFVAMGIVTGAVFAAAGPATLPALFNTPGRLEGALRGAIVFFAAQVVTDLIVNGIEANLEGLLRVDLSRVLDAFRRTAMAGATITVALLGGGLRGVAAASLAASAVAVIVGAALLAANLHGPLRRPARSDIVPLLAYGSRIALVRPFGVLHRTMDRVIVGAVLGPSSVAVVEVATQIQNGVDAVLSASAYGVTPGASWLRARGDTAALRSLLARGTKYSLLATVPLAALIAVLAPTIVRVWVGPSYAAAGGLAAVGLAYVAVSAPIQVGQNVMTGSGRAGGLIVPVSSAVVVNLVASIVLVNAVGIVGAFEATLVAAAVLVPWVGRRFLADVDETVSSFVRAAVVPALAPAAAAAAGAALAVALPLADVATLAVGTAVGGAAAVGAARRWAVDRAELDELVAAARGPADE